jgi:DNA-binding CsgD family transcriptional regulator
MDSFSRPLPSFPLGSSGRQATAELFDMIPWGVLLLDAAGRLLYANVRAYVLLEEGDGLVLQRNRPRSVSASHTERLAALIEQAGEGSDGGALALPRTSGARPLLAEVIAIRRSGPSFLGRRAAAALWISSPDWRVSISPDRLKVFFGLTTRQAELATLLVEGHGLERAADQIGISRHTAHTHLRRVLEKTGAHRQAELVRVVLCSPAALRREQA